MASSYTVNKSIEKPAYNDYAANPTGWSGPVNSDWDIIDRAFGGVQVKNPTGISGTVNLVASEYQAAILIFGASVTTPATVSANIIYTIPSGVGGVWNVFNNTSGAYTITLASLGGGTSVVAPQGKRVTLSSDGTNIGIISAEPITTTPPFPSGTAMLFAQTAAPTGWTKSTTHDNKALRVVSGAASSGGSVAFTTAFTSQSVSGTVGDTTLSLSQIPAHTHTTGSTLRSGIGGGGASIYEALGTTGLTSGSAGTGGSHTHTFTGTAINLAVSYVDVIIAVKD